ncbi:hypothetical protein R75461_08240 [Paraburkholderia nemoris]|nr:hypothetical protein R75461_08240 [Paraburkholderia nemoris]
MKKNIPPETADSAQPAPASRERRSKPKSVRRPERGLDSCEKPVTARNIAADIHRVMVAGERYTVDQLSKLVAHGPASVRHCLADAVARGVVRRSTQDGRIVVFWKRTDPESEGSEREQDHRSRLAQTLQGYDSCMSRFRELCMATRRGDVRSCNIAGPSTMLAGGAGAGTPDVAGDGKPPAVR